MFVSDAFDRFTELILVITIFGGTMCNLESLGFDVACGSDAASRQAVTPPAARPCAGLAMAQGLLSFTPGRALCREHRQRLGEPLHRPGAHVFKADRRVRGRDRRRLAIDEDLTIAPG
jgi:hypothetical protein